MCCFLSIDRGGDELRAGTTRTEHRGAVKDAQCVHDRDGDAGNGIPSTSHVG